MGVDLALLVVGIPTIDWESSTQSLCIFLSVSPFFVSVSPASLLGLHSLQTKSPGVHHCDLFRSIESVTHAIRLTVFFSGCCSSSCCLRFIIPASQHNTHAQTHSTENQNPARVVLESIPTLPLYPDTAQVSCSLVVCSAGIWRLFGVGVSRRSPNQSIIGRELNSSGEAEENKATANGIFCPSHCRRRRVCGFTCLLNARFPPTIRGIIY